MPPASAAGFYEASAAAVWGDKDASDLWYYKEDFLNLNALKSAVAAWDLDPAHKNDPIVIAVVDCGLSSSHELFEDALVLNQDGSVKGWNAVDGSDNFTDITGGNHPYHGTQTAGVIAMLLQELNLTEYIKIYPIKASNDNGGFSAAAVKAAIGRAVEDEAFVVNMSFATDKSGESVWADNRELKSAVAEASKSAVLVAAAGNERADSATFRAYPASYGGVVSVMGYGKDGNKYSSSNYGAYSLIAPGTDIWTAKYGTKTYASESGTSAAAPFVSLTAALLKLKSKADRLSGAQDSELSAPVISNILKKFGDSYVNHGSYRLKKLDILGLITTDFDDSGLGYAMPTDLEINEAEGKLDKDGVYSERIDRVGELRLSAEILPLNETDPLLEQGVEWYEVKDGRETLLGRGSTIKYTPSGGEYYVEARLKYESETLVSRAQFKISYMNYIAGDVRVTIAADKDKNARDALGNLTMYVGGSVTLALTGTRYLDPFEEIKWFVNGEYVGSGKSFDFAPNKRGVYRISAQYGDNNVVAADYNMVIDVQRWIRRPLNAATVSLSAIIIAAAISAVVGAEIKRKKAKNSPKE